MTARPRGRAHLGLAVLVAALALPAAGAPASAAGSAGVDRTVGDSRIGEASGLAASLLRPGVLWTHNDSGNPARLYALAPDGSTADAVKVSGTLDRDWEAITAFRGRSGRPMLAVGDIGDNNEHDDTVQVVVLDEPKAGETRARPVALLSLRYPTGPVNAESLMVDPTSGRMYIATKELLQSRLFEVPAAAWPGGSGSTATLTEVGRVPIGLATDGAFLPDGRLLLRNYSSVLVLQRPADLTGGRVRVLASADTPVQDQGESVAVVDGGAGLLVGSEGKDEPIYRMAVPVAVDPSLLGSAGTPTSGAGTGSTAVPTVVQTPPAGATEQRSVGVAADGAGDLGARILLALVALAAVAGLYGAARYLRSRSGGRAGARRAGRR
jgi:hypothetical protein